MGKKIIWILILILNCCLSFSQHEIKLKSGEIINGEVKSLSNGNLVISFKDNDINLKVSDLECIFFSKPLASSKTENEIKGELKGVVTYFFNRNLGDKPDVGAKVLIQKTDSLMAKNSVLENYLIVQKHKSIIRLGLISKEEVNKELKKFDADTEEGIEKLDNNASKELFQAELKALKLTVDANGSYSVKLEPGMYEVIIVSNGRKGYTQTELLGQVYRKVITIKAGEVLNIDNRFNIN